MQFLVGVVAFKRLLLQELQLVEMVGQDLLAAAVETFQEIPERALVAMVVME
jgi:hypothetical protein